MKRNAGFTKGRTIAFICCGLLPVIVTVLAIVMLAKGVIFEFGFALTFIILPLIATCLLAWCLFSGINPIIKGILVGLLLVVFTVSFLFSFIVSGFEQVKHYNGVQAQQQYAAVKEENPLMPALSEIGSTQSMECHNVYGYVFIFDWETDYLICRYNAEEYEKQKAALETKYTFQEETIHGYDEDCPAWAMIDGYQFRFLSFDAYSDLMFPKYLIMIGYSDQAQEIVYLVFDDIDLDYITSLEEFILDDCGWKYIR